MQHVKEAFHWTRKHEVSIVLLLMLCLLATSIALISQKDGQIKLLKEQLNDKDIKLELANMLYDDAISQIVELQAQVEQKEAELVQVREALNRVVLAP